MTVGEQSSDVCGMSAAVRLVGANTVADGVVDIAISARPTIAKKAAVVLSLTLAAVCSGPHVAAGALTSGVGVPRYHRGVATAVQRIGAGSVA